MAPALKPELDREHPVVAWAAILAILAAILLIAWARVEVHGTGDLEAALSDDRSGAASTAPKPPAEADQSRREEELEKAVAASRWAGGFSP